MRKLEPGAETVDCAAGESFIVELESGSATGYEWIVTMDGASGAIELVSREIRRPSGGGAGRRVGGPQTERFEFAARQAGQVGIRFDLKRSWESEIAETQPLMIEVK